MFVFGNFTWCCGERSWQSYSHMLTNRWWPVVGGASRHSCSKDQSLISPKGYRNNRRLMQVFKVEELRKRGILTNVIILRCYIYCHILVGLFK